MLYKELQEPGKKLLSYDKHSQGPYSDAYQGTTEYVGTVKDITAFEKDLTAKSDRGDYYDMLYAAVKDGEY